MRKATALLVSIASASALAATTPALAAGVSVTPSQVGGLVGGAGLGAVGGPVGGFVGGFVGKKIGHMFDWKPPKLGPVEQPVERQVRPLSAERPLEVKTVAATDDITVDQTQTYLAQQSSAPRPAEPVMRVANNAPAEPAFAPRATGADTRADTPPRGTLDYQLVALQHGASPRD